MAVSEFNGVESECVVTHIEVGDDVFTGNEDADSGVAQDFIAEAGVEDIVGIAIVC